MDKTHNIPLLRRRITSAACIAFAGFMTPSAHAAPPGAGWAMAWSDEFEGTAVNTANWTLGTGARRHATNTANAVSVSGGALTVKTYTEGGTHYTGWLGSNGKFENAFGYWEARIRFSSTAGMWSAFWLQPYGINNIGDPAGNGTEIDIVEHRRQDSGGADMRNKSAINIHWDGYGTNHQSVGSTVNNPNADPTSLQGNYHTYGLLWEPGKYTFYIDGAEVWTSTTAISQVRQWIYLTSEVENGSWAGNVPAGGYGDRNATTTKFDVDWVRFWQRSEQVINPAFTHRSGPWAGSGSTSWSATGGRSGGPGVRLNPSTTTASAYEQSIHGLLPNTEYRLLGWGNVGSRTWPDIRFGVKNHGNPEVWQSIWSNGFTQSQVPFVTGSANTSARVYARVPTQWGDCYADDIEVRRDAQINNAGFELGETWPWTVSGDAFLHDWSSYKRSGSHAFRLNGSASARGIEQTVYGLKASTTYQLACWIRAGGQALRLGVKNHGAAEAYSTFTGTGNTWQRGTHTFTTGASATSATIYAFIPAGSNVGALDLDDLSLGRSISSPWTATDIGTAARAGDSHTRNSKLVLRGSGANVFDAEDAFHFVRQTVAGDHVLTAKLDSFEANHPRAKAGVMMRGTTAANSAHAMVHWMTEGRVEFVWRASNGAASGYAWSTATVSWPPRLKLQRVGSLVTASYSTDGSTWIQVGTPQTVPLPGSTLSGVAVCAHDTNNTATGVFSNISVTGDRDGDGLLDDHETNTGIYVSASNTGTDPDNEDTDGDSYADGFEVAGGTSPLVPNTELIWQPGTTPGGTGAWNATATNWKIGSASTLWKSGKTAVFGGTAGTVSMGAGADGIAGMNFNTSGYHIDGSGFLAFAQEASLANAPNITSTISAPLSGTSDLGLTGGGTFHLRGDNRSFSGSLTLDGSTQLRLYNTSTNIPSGYEGGSPQTTLSVKSGSQIRWFNIGANATYAQGFHISGTGGTNPGALNLDTSSARTLTFTGDVLLEANATVACQNAASYVFSGPVSGAFALTVSQGTGSTTFQNRIETTQLIKTGGGTLTFGPTSTPSIPLLKHQGGSISHAATATDTGIHALTLESPLSLVISAPLDIEGAVSGASSLTKSGAATLRLSGSCSHQGATTITAGILRVDGTVSHSPITIQSGATLSGTGTLSSASVSGRVVKAIDEAPLQINGALTLNGASLVLSGSTTAPVIELIRRGSVSGNFSSISGVPTGYALDMAYSGNSIALVRKPTADFEIWAGGHGLDPVSNGAAMQDPDRDGFHNSVEFVLGMDPSEGRTDSPNLPKASREGNTFKVSFTRVKVAATNGFNSRIEWSSTLANPSWTEATPGQIQVIDHGETETVTAGIPVPSGTSSLYARLKVIAP